MLARTANEVDSLKAEQAVLKKENDKLVEEIASRDREAGVEGFARGVEACQAEIRAQVQRFLYEAFQEPSPRARAFERLGTTRESERSRETHMLSGSARRRFLPRLTHMKR